jgi:uncharacterized phosphosugar-binding protein
MPSMTSSTPYTRAVIDLLERLASTQDEVLGQVAARCADTIGQGGLVHLFGSGHSVIPTLEAFPRYGSFVGLYPLNDPRLMWHNVLGPGGVRELLWLERTENYVDKFLDHEPLNPGDVIIIYSHSGRNAAGIDTAIYARKRGLFTVAVSSVAAQDRPSVHSSGYNLSQVCDVTIDTGVPVQDAVVTVDAWDRPVGGASTVVACVVSHELITRTAAVLAERGVSVPVFVSPTVQGASVESNDQVFAAHDHLVHKARGKKFAAEGPTVS